MSSPQLLVDPDGRRVGDAVSGTVGTPGPMPGRRVVWAQLTNEPGGSPTRRYVPSWAPNEADAVGLNMAQVIPNGVGVSTVSLTIWTNTATPTLTTDFVIGIPSIEGRVVYATLSGGVVGRDYQLRWVVTDTLSNVWPRTALLLCSTPS